MSKSDNQLVEIWNSFGVYVEIFKKLSSLVDSHLVTHYIIKELAHFAKEMVTNKWKGNEMGINKWITKRKWESTSEIRIVVFFGFPNLDMMDRKSDNQTSSRTTRSARPWCGWKDFVRFSIHHTLKMKFRSVLLSEHLLIPTFLTQFCTKTCWFPRLNFRTKISKKTQCASCQNALNPLLI